MPRSDGKFPKYHRVDIDPEIWPNKYWDASRWCPSCETHWPHIFIFAKSPCCGIETEIDEENAPDMRWPDAVKAYLTSRFEHLYDKYNEGLSDQDLVYEDAKEQADFDFDKIDIESNVNALN